MRSILIVGATSAIAIATARQLTRPGTRFFLLARDPERLQGLAEDLRVRGATSVETAPFQADDFESHAHQIDAMLASVDTLDIALICHGSLPDQRACEASQLQALREVTVNGLSVVSLLTLIANRMERQSSGCIAVITSVAADRGRQSNYVYGAAKAMVSTFLQGLRNRLHARGINVLEIKPGFVDTPMTADFAKNFLWAQPEAVAADIVGAIDKGRDVIYTPGFWRAIMLVIRSIPAFIFNRLKL